MTKFDEAVERRARVMEAALLDEGIDAAIPVDVLARATFTADTEAGFEVVPVECTEAMLVAFHQVPSYRYQERINAAIAKGAIREESE